MPVDAARGTVWDHLEDLRKTFLRAFGVIFAATFLSFAFYQPILSFLTLPLSDVAQGHTKGSLMITPYQIVRQTVSNVTTMSAEYELSSEEHLLASTKATQIGTNRYLIDPTGSLEIEKKQQADRLVVLGPIEGFRTALKACFWFGLVSSSPLWLLFVFQFVAPGLYESEQRLALPIIAFCLAFLAVGLLFGFYIAIPIANEALYAFNGSVGLNLWSLALYLDYTVVLLMANALAFELSALLLLLVHHRVVAEEWLRNKRRMMYVVIFLISAFLTPPDVLTQLLMAFPLLGMYELIVLYARWRQTWRVPVQMR